MRNVFLLYMPPGNPAAMVHYDDTIKKKVDIRRLGQFLSQDLRARLISVFGGNPIAVWGSEAGPRNRSNFERMSEGDDILIVEGDSVRLIGKIAAKLESPELSRELWKPLTGQGDTTWQLIYFIANPRELNVPFQEFGRLFGYDPYYRLRGFTTVAPEKLTAFYAKYDDLYSVLVRMQTGEPISEKPSDTDFVRLQPELAADLVELSPDDVVTSKCSGSSRASASRPAKECGYRWETKPSSERFTSSTRSILSLLPGSIYHIRTSRTSTLCGNRSFALEPPTRSRTLRRSTPVS
jgi:hypothetical protein